MNLSNKMPLRLEIDKTEKDTDNKKFRQLSLESQKTRQKIIGIVVLS